MSSLISSNNTMNMNLMHIGGGNHQFGDTTYTKVFVGGLAWETQKDTLKNYFQQFGDILEAVVIIDKITARSKGYGFVTFKEAESARKACVDPAPVIDGRRANCNLASLGVQRSTPSTPQHPPGGGGGRNFKVMKSGGVGRTSFPASVPHYAIQQGIPCTTSPFGYSPYSTNYTYPTSYYGACGGTNSPYVVYGANSSYYPYMQYGMGMDFQYPQHHFHYPIVPHHYSPMPFSHSAGGSVSTGVAAPAGALLPFYSS